MTHHQPHAIDTPRVCNISAPEHAPSGHRVEVSATLTYESPDLAHACEDRAIRLWVEPRDLRVMRALGPTAVVHVLAPNPRAARPSSNDSSVDTSSRALMPATITIDLQTAATGRIIIPGWGLRHLQPVSVGYRPDE